MAKKPEDQARENIDRMLDQADWTVQDLRDANIHVKQGVAIRDFPLTSGHGFADYLLYVDGKAAGVIEAKKVGMTLTGVEIQSDKYKHGLPASLPSWLQPLPFCYQSTGVETRFTNGLDPDPRSRNVFAFHRPDTMAEWLDQEPPSKLNQAAERFGLFGKPSSLRSRLFDLPPLIEEGLWPAQKNAIKNLENSLIENRPRALIQMATGSGKTFTAVTFIYRLIKFAKAKRILFLVDRANLGRQTLREFQQYSSPYSPYKFTEEFLVQHLKSNQIDKTSRVCISTIQRLYSLLKGEEIDPELEEESLFDHTDLFKEPPPVEYNPEIPPETFDIIVTDECHRSIYNLWRQVLEYFDAFTIGLTATPNKQTFGFFNQNLVMEYGHEQAVADGVNVNYDVYRIRTKITEAGSKVDAGYYVDKRDRETRVVRWERLDEELEYGADQLDTDVVAVDQIRKVVQTFRDKLPSDIFPGRKDVPKTLVFAKDDSHAEDIVKIVREEFAKGNDFCQKITYKTTGKKPEDLIAEFRNSYHPRIAVTVDMMSTGTDVKPLEIVCFLRSVKSRSFFEQMKGRGVRIINDSDLQLVTPDAKAKTHFIIVDAVGVCEQDKSESRPMEKKRFAPLEKLLQSVALGNTEPDVISSIAGRLARLEKRISADDKTELKKLSKGKSLGEITGTLVRALDPDRHIGQAKKDNPGAGGPSEEQIRKSAEKIIKDAVKPFHNPELRRKLVELHKAFEQTIDTVSQDEVIEAGFSADALERAKGIVSSFEDFIREHKDEITALQILYSKPYKSRLRYEEIKDLADRIEKPPYLLKIDRLWEAYAALEKSKVREASAPRLLTDLVSLVRFAIQQDNELVPFPDRVNVNFRAWLGHQENIGRKFTDEQKHWLEMIRDHIAANLSIDKEDFDLAPFTQEGGIGKAFQIFGKNLDIILEEMNSGLSG